MRPTRTAIPGANDLTHPAGRSPSLRWRLLSPPGAVLLAFLLLAVGAGSLSALSLSDASVAAVLSSATSLLLLAFGFGLWRLLPGHERRLTSASKGSCPGVVLAGVGMGLALVAGTAGIMVAGSALDPAVERRLEDVEPIGTAPWQLGLTLLALVVLAPLGEELLFRGLMLRALVRVLRFWPAAFVSAALFTAAHLDAYVLWPRAISVFATVVALAWLYRQRGYVAIVVAHGVVNAVAFVGLLASS